MTILQVVDGGATKWTAVIATITFLGVLLDRLIAFSDRRTERIKADAKQRRLEEKEDADEQRARERADRVAAVAVAAETVAKNVAIATTNAETAASQNAVILEDIQATGKKTHILVNSQKGIVMAAYARVARLLADNTRDPAHIAEANEAERAEQEHVKLQAIVDEENK